MRTYTDMMQIISTRRIISKHNLMTLWQDMYSQGDSFDPAVREWLGMARADICPTCQVPIAILHCYQLLSLYRCASHLRDFTPVGFPFHPISTSRLLERPREHISKSRQRHLRVSQPGCEQTLANHWGLPNPMSPKTDHE